ncbi:hypothetical protein, partial [Actinomadura fibrosa]|uniref:hypothetical protein n=1 Tax=Actinomadura fibrosa TaxID=111802 RepID=UPI00352049AF
IAVPADEPLAWTRPSAPDDSRPPRGARAAADGAAAVRRAPRPRSRFRPGTRPPPTRPEHLERLPPADIGGAPAAGPRPSRCAGE